MGYSVIFNLRKIRFCLLSIDVDMSPDSGQGNEAEGKCGVKSIKCNNVGVLFRNWL